MPATCSLGALRPNLPLFDTDPVNDFARTGQLLVSNPDVSEQYKRQVLIGQIKFPSALNFAKAFIHDPQALGQPRGLVQRELGVICNAPALRLSDPTAFETS